MCTLQRGNSHVKVEVVAIVAVSANYHLPPMTVASQPVASSGAMETTVAIILHATRPVTSSRADADGRRMSVHY